MAEKSCFRLMGQYLSVTEFVSRVARQDESLVQLVVSQLLADQASGRSYSEGLVAVDLGWGRAIKRFLGQEFFGTRVELAQIAWNATLLRVFERIGQFDRARSRFSTWLFNQARYSALDEVRRLKREARLVQRAQSDPAGVRSDVLEAADVTTSQRSALRRALRRLSETDRELIWLYLVEELSYDEICDRLSRPVKREHLRVAVSRAIARFQRVGQEELERRT